MVLFLMPGVAAQAEENPFPNAPLKLSSHFVKENFSSKITLSQVLLVLFTITDNPYLLSLYARQQNSEYPEETHSSDSGRIRALAQALQEKLGDVRGCSALSNVSSDISPSPLYIPPHHR